MPPSARPSEAPTIDASANGVSNTRSGPNLSWSPRVTRKTPPSILLERDVEEHLVNARILHLADILGDLLPCTACDRSCCVVERLLRPLHEAAHHGLQLVRIAAPLLRRFHDCLPHREK